MARHSHWHNIQVTKGKADAKRAKVFTKIAKKITLAAKEGEGLQTAIDAARAVNMTKDAIDRAIARGTGGAEGANLESVLYEGFGPGGVAVMIEAVTDNRNRTVAEVKSIASKKGGSIGAQGSVKWMFDHKAVVRIEHASLPLSEGEGIGGDFELELIDAGADDIHVDEQGMTILADSKHLQAIKDAVAKRGIEPASAAVEYIANTTTAIGDDVRADLDVFVEALEDNDDVSMVYTNEA